MAYDYNSNESSNNYYALSETEKAIIDTYSEQIAALAQESVYGGQDVETQLAALVEGAPENVRIEVVKRFRSIVSELQEEVGIDEAELTPQQQEALRIHKERERMMLANWLSEKTLEKIRRAIISNPQLLNNIISLGEKLQREGVMFDTRRPVISSSEIGTVATPQKTPVNKDAIKGSDSQSR